MSNQFFILIGHENRTNLPSQLFDKVVIRDALHHFKAQDEMLADIKRIMKPQAKLILFEPLKGLGPADDNLCKGAMTQSELLSLLQQNGFKPTRDPVFKSSGAWFEFTLETN